MRTISEKGRLEEFAMDLQISHTKAISCLHKFKQTWDQRFIELAESHLKNQNGFWREIDRVQNSIDDVGAYLGIEYIGNRAVG